MPIQHCGVGVGPHTDPVDEWCSAVGARTLGVNMVVTMMATGVNPCPACGNTTVGLTPRRWRAGMGARPLYLEGCILREGVAGEGNQTCPLGR
jgi:hypothetical protein